MIGAVLCLPDPTRRSPLAIAHAASAAAIAALVGGLIAGAAIGSRLHRVVVRGASMEPTLIDGDRLLVLARRRARTGTLVALHDPRQPGGELLVKRVAAVEVTGVDVRGDNPAHSTDSRTFGLVASTLVVGRVIWRYGPPERAGRLR